LDPQVERLKPEVEVLVNGISFFLNVCLNSSVEATYVQHLSQVEELRSQQSEHHQLGHRPRSGSRSFPSADTGRRHPASSACCEARWLASLAATLAKAWQAARCAAAEI